MKVKGLLRETYWGDEFLIEEDGEDKVLKIVKIPIDRHFFFNEYSKLKRLQIPNILIPAKVRISGEKYLFFYPYYQHLKPLESLNKKISRQLLKLFTFLSKAGVIVPVLGLDDILLGEGVFLVPSFISDPPQGAGGVVFAREKTPQATRQVCYQFLKHHGVNQLDYESDLSIPLFTEARFPYIHREVEEKIKRDIDHATRFPLLILITGEQRVGKTKMASVLADDLREKGFLVHQTFSLVDLKMWYNVSDELDLLTKLEDGQEKVILIDDLSDGLDLFPFMEELSTISTSTKIIVLATSTKTYNFFHKIYRLSPFTLKETQALLERSLGKISDSQVKLIYSLSRGLPGYMVEILKVLNRTDLKSNILDVFKPLLQALDSPGIRDLSVLGQKFTGIEIQALQEITGEDFSEVIEKAIDSGIIVVEAGHYRFTLKEFWDYYYRKVSDERKNLLHEQLFKKLPEDLAVKHALSIEDVKTRAIQILRYVRNHFWEYEKTKLMIEYLERLGKSLGKTHYSIESLKMKLLFRMDPFRIEKEDFKSSWIARLKELAGNPERIFEKSEHLSYRDLYSLAIVSRSYRRSGKRVPQKLLKLIEKELEKKNFSTKERRYLKAVLLYELFVASENRELLRNAMHIATREKFLDVEVSGYRALGALSRTRAMSNYYFNRSLEISKKIDPSLAIVDESNLTWNLLYEGKISAFLTQLNRLRKQSQLFGNVTILSYTYFLEGLYHLHRKDYQNAEKIFKFELDLEERNHIERRALRGLVINYLFAGDFEGARSLLKKEEPEFERFGFEFLREMVLAENDTEFLKSWKKAIEQPRKFFNEEIAYVFAERLAKLDPESFEEFALELEKENVENASDLTLALVYESLYRFYNALDLNFRAKRFLKKAVLIYNAIGLKEVSLKLETNLGTFSVENRIPHYLFISFIEPDKDFSEMMELVAAKLSEVIPYEVFSLKIVERRTGKTIEEFNSSFSSVPDGKDFLEISPFRALMSFNLDMKHDTMIYIDTNLECDEKSAWELVETLEWFGHTLTVVLRERLYRDRSIKDLLTGVFSRWYFMERLEEEAYRSTRYRMPLSLIMCDIDDFKGLNDQFGHMSGDSVLRWVGKKLLSLLRKSDLVGRYGGEEFVIALPGTSLGEAKLVAEKLRNAVKDDPENVHHITMSFGVAEFTPGESPFETIKRADEALYMAKFLGKDRVITEQELSQRSS
ncbi:diguanylate cyclase [Thermotoga sp.]|uniref:diguanylate cyclase n=1 Tax=Thermotoga sp. TaxID=28240 RepID=UPI0025F6CFD1|nr:diguanylate cyclase [Thermotoga sp.]MCD6552115.1 diguanylate cyclase [Thermotoga sp.]